ncbi:MAG: transglutaminase domain-containing protein [Bacteroidota bacterium]
MNALILLEHQYMNYKQITIFLFLFFTISLLSAQPNVELLSEQSKHPDDFIIYTTRKSDIDISHKEGKLLITSDVYEETFILKNLAVLNDQESVQYSDFYKLTFLEAYTLVPNKNNYKRVDVKDFKDRHVFDDMVFHNDISERVFAYSDLAVGTKKVLHYKQEFTQPELLDGFFFASSIFCNNSKLTITVDEDIDLGFKLFNTADYPIQYSSAANKDRKVYTWQYENSEKVDQIDDVFSIRYYIPHIIYHIKSYMYNGKQQNVLANLDDLHAYYNTFISTNNQSNNDKALKVIADSIILGANTDEEKIKKIYYWVKDHIRYVAFEDGFGGFIPRNAVEVCDKKFGDCKDMANLLVALIQIEKIPNVYLSWIGSNDLPYDYEDIPTTAIDNHMIATYKKDSQYIFLDATSKYTPWGYPSEFIQNKEAMVHIDSNHYEIVRVPAVEAGMNTYLVETNIQLDGDLVKGHGSLNTFGYYKDYMLEMLSDYTGEKRMKEIKPYLELGNNKFFLKDYNEQHVNNRDEHYIVNYDFELANYALNVEDKKYINLFFNKYLDNSKIDTTRKIDKYFRYADTHAYHITLDLPKGYEVQYLPKDMNIDNDLIQFSSHFVKTATQVVLEYMITLKKMQIKKEQFPLWNATLIQLNKILSENIALKKST